MIEKFPDDKQELTQIQDAFYDPMAKAKEITCAEQAKKILTILIGREKILAQEILTSTLT